MVQVIFLKATYRKLAISTRDKITETFNKTSHGYSADIPTPPPLHRMATEFALGSFLLFQVVFYFFTTQEPHLSPPDLSNLPDFFKAVK